MTMSPSIISYQTIFRLKSMGSIKETNSVPVEKQANVTDTLETLIA